MAEATKLGIPVISLSGTDCDINKIAYPIVVNDSALSGIKFMLEELMKAYQAGKTAGVLALAEQAEKIEKEKEEVIAENYKTIFHSVYVLLNRPLARRAPRGFQKGVL